MMTHSCLPNSSDHCALTQPYTSTCGTTFNAHRGTQTQSRTQTQTQTQTETTTWTAVRTCSFPCPTASMRSFLPVLRTEPTILLWHQPEGVCNGAWISQKAWVDWGDCGHRGPHTSQVASKYVRKRVVKVYSCSVPTVITGNPKVEMSRCFFKHRALQCGRYWLNLGAPTVRLYLISFTADFTYQNQKATDVLSSDRVSTVTNGKTAYLQLRFYWQKYH